MIRAALLSLVLTGAALAQPAAILVTADGASAVLVDGALAGAPGEWIDVAPGSRRVQATADAGVWGSRRVETEVDVAPGDSLRLALTLPRRVRVETLPIRALVVFESTAGAVDTLGTGPVTVDLVPDETGTVTATLEGYAPASASLGPGADVVTLVLRPAAGAQPEIALLPTARSTRRRTTVDVALGAASLAAGALAIHFKFRADGIDDDYRGPDPALRGDEALRQDALRYDRYSAVALGAMQVGLGTLAVRLIFR